MSANTNRKTVVLKNTNATLPESPKNALGIAFIFGVFSAIILAAPYITGF